MSSFNVHELLTSGEIKQHIVTGDDNILLTNIQLHLYKHGHPPGGMSCEVQDSNQNTILASSDVTIAAIDADISSADFFHGLVRFDLTYPLRSNSTYYVSLKANGSYAFNETASGSTGYVGWVAGSDWNYTSNDYEPSIGWNAPLILNLWHRKIVRKAGL
jgi:hypothetical protein